MEIKFHQNLILHSRTFLQYYLDTMWCLAKLFYLNPYHFWHLQHHIQRKHWPMTKHFHVWHSVEHPHSNTSISTTFDNTTATTHLLKRRWSFNWKYNGQKLCSMRVNGVSKFEFYQLNSTEPYEVLCSVDESNTIQIPLIINFA